MRIMGEGEARALVITSIVILLVLVNTINTTSY